MKLIRLTGVKISVAEHRTTYGFVWGVIATVAMSIPMVIGVATGIAPMPRPIPEAVVSLVIGGAPQPVRMVLAVITHLLYGGVFGAIFASVVDPVSVLKGLGLGVLLWAAMGIAVLPLLGWGPFGTAVTPRVAVATLVLHLIYGTVLGATLDSDVALPRHTRVSSN